MPSKRDRRAAVRAPGARPPASPRQSYCNLTQAPASPRQSYRHLTQAPASPRQSYRNLTQAPASPRQSYRNLTQAQEPPIHPTFIIYLRSAEKARLLSQTLVLYNPEPTAQEGKQLAYVPEEPSSPAQRTT